MRPHCAKEFLLVQEHPVFYTRDEGTKVGVHTVLPLLSIYRYRFFIPIWPSQSLMTITPTTEPYGFVESDVRHAFWCIFRYKEQISQYRFCENLVYKHDCTIPKCL